MEVLVSDEPYTLDSLLSEVDSRTHQAISEIILSALKMDEEELRIELYKKMRDCKKCNELVTAYVNSKLKLRKAERTSADHLFPAVSSISLRILRETLEGHKVAFHESQCTCGIQTWRGRSWIIQQHPSYKPFYEDYTRWRRENQHDDRDQAC